MRFDLVSLKLFIAVCEQQSIARAAEREHIAASAVSKRISDLEEILKSSLFHRTSKGLELTPSGDALLYHARVIFGDLLKMESELADHAKGICGRVRIHAGVSSIIQHLPQDLSNFLAQYGEISIDLEEGTSQEIVRSVAENAADIGIFGGCQPMAGLLMLPYRSDKLAAIMPIDHPLSKKTSVKFAELAKYNLIGPKKGSFLDSLIVRAAADLSLPLNLQIRVYGFETVRSMVEVGLGVGIVPQQCACHYVNVGRLASVPLDEEWAVRNWKICVRDVQSLSPPARLLVNHLSSAAEQKTGRVIQIARQAAS